MARLFFVRMGAAMALGIFGAYTYEGLFSYTIAAYTFGLLLSLFVICCLWYSRLSMHRFTTEMAILVYGLYFYGGVWICLFQKSKDTPVYDRAEAQSGIHVRLIDEPQYKLKFIRCKALVINNANNAPNPAEGKVERIVMG